MTILCIETSTNCCSAAIAINGEAKAIRANLTGANHASELPLFVEELMNEARVNSWTIDAVALSQGPGSYTGLRIGASMAKGLCYGLNIPLIPVDTLQILCAAAKDLQSDLDGILCPMLDARRMEVYTAKYQPSDLKAIGEVEAKIIDEQSFADELEQEVMYFFGNGAEKCKAVIQSGNARFVDDIVPQAKYMGQLAETAAPLDIKQMAYYEPFYLKEFVPAASHVKGLN